MKRPATYCALYVLILAAVAVLVDARRELDFRFFEWAHGSAPPTWRDDVLVIDLPYGDAPHGPADAAARNGIASEFLAFRARLTEFLKHLTTRPDRARAVLLDVWISEDPRGLNELRGSIQGLVDAKIPVFGAIRLINRQDPLAEHDKISYRLLDGVGHTEFLEGGDHTILYMCRIETADAAQIAALQVLLMEALYQISPGVCPVGRHVLLGLGSPGEYRSHASQFDSTNPHALFGRSSPDRSQADLSFNGKILIVGSPGRDPVHADGARHLNAINEGRPGPELLAWAVMERLSVAEQRIRPLEPLWNPWLLLGTTVFFSLLACLAYVGVHRIFASSRNKLLWTAVCACLIAFAAVGLFIEMLKLLGQIYVQVTLVVAGIVIATALTWRHFWWKTFLERIKAQIRSEAFSTPSRWDVFVSYSRDLQNESWVRNEIYEPLRRETKDGRQFEVFLDKQTLRPGASWYQDLAKAVLASRYFVAVYSQDYFKRDYCRLEMDWACLIREQRPDFIFPIGKDEVEVPSPYRHIHYTKISETKDFVLQIAERVRGGASSQE